MVVYATLLPLLHWLACDVETPIGAECLQITEVVTSATDWVYRYGDCRFEEVPDTGLDLVDYRVDWVEICNPSEQSIEAGEYTVEDMRDRIQTQLGQERGYRRLLDMLRKATYVAVFPIEGSLGKQRSERLPR